jgi:hypothetical protein
MVRRKKNKKDKKRNIAIAASTLGLGAIGAGAYLLSRRKGGNSTIPNVGGIPKLNNAPNIKTSSQSAQIQQQIRNNIPKPTGNVWDNIGAKLPNRNTQLRIDPPGKLALIRQRTPDLDWDTVQSKINQRKNTPSLGQVSSPSPQKLLAPGSKIPSSADIKGYYRGDGTFVRGHERKIERILKKDEVDRIAKSLNETVTDGATTKKWRRINKTDKVWSAEKNKAIDDLVTQRNAEIQDAVRSTRDNLAQNYTTPILLEGGTTLSDPSVSPTAKENMRDRYRNSAYHVDTVARLESEAKEINTRLRRQAAESISADKESFKEKLAQLRRDTANAQVDIFDEPIATANIGEDIASLERSLRDTLEDPFAPNYFETNRQQIKNTENKIVEKLAKVEEKIKQPEVSLQQARKLKAELELMKKKYNDNLANLYENSDEVKLLRSKLEQEKLLLEGLSESEVTNDVWRQRKQLAENMRQMEQRKYFGEYKDNNLDSLNNLISSAKKIETTAKNKIKNPSVELVEKQKELLELSAQLKQLPLTKRNLSREQKRILAEFDNMPKKYKQIFGKVSGEIKQLHELEKQFKADYDALSRNHDIYVGNIFSNNSVNDYVRDVEKGIGYLEMRAGRFERNVAIVEDLHNPESYITRYKDYLANISDGNSSSLAQVGANSGDILDHTMRRKKAIMQGGIIDGKQYQGVIKDLEIDKDVSYMKASLLNLYGTNNIAKQMSNVTTIEQQLDKLTQDYIRRKGGILRSVQNEVNNLAKDIDYLTYRNDPSMRKLTDQVNKALGNYTSEFGETDITSTFFKQKGLIDDAKVHLQELAKIQPKYEIGDNGEIRPDRIMRTDVPAAELNKEVIDHLEKRYGSAVSKSKSKRKSIAKIYYDMNESGLKLEGEDTFFDHLRSGTLRDAKEAEYWNGLGDNEKYMLKNFADTKMDREFQSYYYTEALSRVFRRPESFNVDNAIALPSDVSNKLGLKKSVVDRSMEYLTGREKASDLVGKKVRDVQETFRNLESMGVEGLSFATYMTDSNGDKVPYRYGLLGVQNMPKKLPGSENRFRNNMIDRLMRQMGINENGMPLVTNVGLVDKLSGVGVRNKEDLKRLLGEMGNSEASLNVLMQAERKNRELLRLRQNNLYLFNFAEKNNNVAFFKQEQ